MRHSGSQYLSIQEASGSFKGDTLSVAIVISRDFQSTLKRRELAINMVLFGFPRRVVDHYFWKTDAQLNHVANVRYAHGDELTDLPGVTGIGIGKDHIILYVSDVTVVVPSRIEDVAIVKICR